MNKSLAILEISSSCVKLVIGYELNGQPQVIYTLVKQSQQIVDNGKFLDVPLLQNILHGLNSIDDVSARLSINIAEVVLILPPYGLDVFKAQQTTYIANEESTVSATDIRNVYNLIRKLPIPENQSLIDIVPESYILDEGTTYKNPPINKSSNALGIVAAVHTLPKHIHKNYEGIVQKSGIQVKRSFVAPFTACKLLAAQKEAPKEYILVDIGSHTTTVSAIGDNQLISSIHFPWGGHKITSKVATNFNISEDEAEKIKITYGLDRRKTEFPVTICLTDDGNGNESKHLASELSDIIKEELDSFVKQLKISINTLLQGFDAHVIRKIPLILSGGGSMLHGLVPYIETKVVSDVISLFAPNTIGARQAIFTNCLGAIVANKKHPLVFDEAHPKIGPVTRDDD